MHFTLQVEYLDLLIPFDAVPYTLAGMLPDALRFLLISWNDENTAKDFDPSTEAYPLAVVLFCLTVSKDLIKIYYPVILHIANQSLISMLRPVCSKNKILTNDKTAIKRKTSQQNV